MDQDLDNWSNNVTCRWIANPDASGPLPDSLDLIPDSEPNSSTAASGEEVGSSEEDLASVSITVQVGSPESSGMEGNASPVMSPGGTWRNSDGSWSLRNFNYNDDDEASREASPGVLSAPNLGATPQSLHGKGREGASEPPAHFNTGDWIARNGERRRRRPTSPDGSPPPPVRSPGGTWRHVDGRWHPRNLYPEPDDRRAKKPRIHLR